MCRYRPSGTSNGPSWTGKKRNWRASHCRSSQSWRSCSNNGALTPPTAKIVAREMTAKDALGVHARAELGIDPENVTNPWAAAGSSMVAFIVGGLVPLLAMVLSPRAIEVGVAGVAVVIAMILTGAISARLGRIAVARSVIRNVAGGLLAMGVTYGVGNIAGTQL